VTLERKPVDVPPARALATPTATNDANMRDLR